MSEETFCFNFDWPKDIDENLKHEIELLKKINESLAVKEIKNEIEQLWLKYKYGNKFYDPTRDCFKKCYMPLVKIKDFNALIGNKLFFDHPVINKQEAFEKPIKMSKNVKCTTGNSLYFISSKLL